MPVPLSGGSIPGVIAAQGIKDCRIPLNGTTAGAYEHAPDGDVGIEGSAAVINPSSPHLAKEVFKSPARKRSSAKGGGTSGTGFYRKIGKRGRDAKKNSASEPPKAANMLGYYAICGSKDTRKWVPVHTTADKDTIQRYKALQRSEFGESWPHEIPKIVTTGKKTLQTPMYFGAVQDNPHVASAQPTRQIYSPCEYAPQLVKSIDKFGTAAFRREGYHALAIFAQGTFASDEGHQASLVPENTASAPDDCEVSNLATNTAGTATSTADNTDGGSSIHSMISASMDANSNGVSINGSGGVLPSPLRSAPSDGDAAKPDVSQNHDVGDSRGSVETQRSPLGMGAFSVVHHRSSNPTPNIACNSGKEFNWRVIDAACDLSRTVGMQVRYLPLCGYKTLRFG